MGLNPFGEESDSLQSWKERYKQQQFQVQTLTGQLSELRSKFHELQLINNETSSELEQRELELTEAKSEIRATIEILKDRENKIRELNTILERNQLEDIKTQNKALQEELENLRGKINRGDINIDQTSMSTGLDDLSTALVPMLLREYDPSSYDSQNIFINLVESIILHGNTESKIIAILIKYGGNGPLRTIRTMVDSINFEEELNRLIEKQVITRMEDQIFINQSFSVLKSDNWENLTTIELFDKMIELTNSNNITELIPLVKNFRDCLQKLDMPITTIFFELRKIIERLEKNELDNIQLRYQIESWKKKYISLV